MDFIVGIIKPLRRCTINVDVSRIDIVNGSDVFFKSDIISAVEWLKENTTENMTAMRFKMMIKEAFPDLYPSGDLIADKQNPQQNICKRCGKDFQIYGDCVTMICDDCSAD